jgi:hypothetical protein
VYRPARISNVLERSSMHSLGTTGLKAGSPPAERIPPSLVSTIPICSSSICLGRTSSAACWLTGCPSTSSGLPGAPVPRRTTRNRPRKRLYAPAARCAASSALLEPCWRVSLRTTGATRPMLPPPPIGSASAVGPACTIRPRAVREG